MPILATMDISGCPQTIGGAFIRGAPLLDISRYFNVYIYTDEESDDTSEDAETAQQRFSILCSFCK